MGRQFYVLARFQGDGGYGLEACLRGAKCGGAVKAVQEASLKAIAILQGKTSSQESVQEVVAAVHEAIEKVLYMSVKNGVGKKNLKQFCRARPPEEDDWDDMFKFAPQKSKPLFLLSMQTICEASAEALEKGDLKDGDFLYNG